MSTTEKNFDIVRFDEEKFNHNLTGYKLTGAHLQVDCRECHKDENIVSSEIRQKKNTFLGLQTNCASCHTDVHQNTLSTNCASCHTTEDFKPATLFDHAKTDFPLKGQHKTVDCASCHQVTIQNGQLFQQFAGRPFNSCTSCHTDEHDNRLGKNCKACHTEESFEILAGKPSFNHQQTDFPLLGKHKQVDCRQCHDLEKYDTPDNVFNDFKGKDIAACQTCHKDVHEGKFGTDCKQCHSETSFQKLVNLDQFQHDLTGFPLAGKHKQVDCRKCHETNLTDPLPHNACSDCHLDFHKGQFVQGAYKPDCKECHTVEGFAGSTYTLEQHNASKFPLTGAHLATPCFACHLKNDEWTFRNIGSACVDCHKDIHQGHLSADYYPQQACNNCHSPESWKEVSFDHDLTSFDLAGRHELISCTACHKPETLSVKQVIIPFTGLTANCVTCHENIHGNQFENNGVTDCTRCHGYDAWTPGIFDHSTARFVLDGAHTKVSCDRCHVPSTDEEGRGIILYRLEKLDCIDCHL